METAVSLLSEAAPYEQHPFAAILPDMTPGQYRTLLQDIHRHGLLEPIVLFENKVLDGRHRLRACVEANVSARFVEFDGKDPVSFVITRNIHRRHLNKGQLALAAARAATLRKGQKSTNTAFAVTQGEAAEQFGVSADTIQRARVILERGGEALIRRVNEGAISISAASDRLRETRQDGVPVSPLPMDLPDNDNDFAMEVAHRLEREVQKLEIGISSIRSRLSSGLNGDRAQEIKDTLNGMRRIINGCEASLQRVS